MGGADPHAAPRPSAGLTSGPRPARPARPPSGLGPDPGDSVNDGYALTTALIAGAFWIGLVLLVEAQQPLRMGASLSQTGPYAAPGQNQLRGHELFVKHTNEKGGVLGRRIELIVEDDQSKAPTAVAIYEKLITQDKVDAILGPYGSAIVEAVADVSEKHKMPMVAASGGVTSGPSITPTTRRRWRRCRRPARRRRA